MTSCMEPTFDKVFDTQKIYRLMLDVLARPGKICILPGLDIYPPPGLTSHMAGTVFTLLDSETTFAVLPGDKSWRDYIELNTGARPAPADSAEFIIMDGRDYHCEIALADRGTLLSPEKGSTLIVMVDSFEKHEPGAIKVTLSGPGIKGYQELTFTGLHRNNLDNISALNHEYPLGVDCFFVESSGAMVAIPRSSTLRWEVIG